MIVRNERERLAACFASVAGVVDEFVVVDTGSTDDTVAAARRLGATVISFPWCNDFSAARNHGLALARGAWILVLDADEQLSAAGRDEVRTLVRQRPERAYSLVQVNATAGGASRVAAVRLFPNRSDVRYEFPVHEQVNAALGRAGIPIAETPIEILHAGYSDPVTVARKAERNRAIVDAALAHTSGGGEEQHLRYYQGNILYQDQRWEEALAEYRRCRALATSDDSAYAHVVELRMADCCYVLGRVDEAERHLEAAARQRENPVALSLRAQLAVRRGDADVARRMFEGVLACPDIPYTPAGPLRDMKVRALQFLADY